MRLESDAASLPLHQGQGVELASLEQLSRRIEALERQEQTVRDTNNGLNLLVFESHRDRLMAAFVIATGAAACGMEVSMFFTFWGTAALRKGGSQQSGKTIIERAFGWLLPTSARKTKLSHLDMGGLGRVLMSREMKKKNIADLDQLLQTASDLEIKIQVCEMSMQLMGIRREELIEYPHLEFCGVATFVEQTSRANSTLFI